MNSDKDDIIFISNKMKLFKDINNKIAHNCVEQSCLIATPKSKDALCAPCCPGPGVYSGQGSAAQRPVQRRVSRGPHTTITSGETCGVLTPLVRIRWHLQTGVNEMKL